MKNVTQIAPRVASEDAPAYAAASIDRKRLASIEQSLAIVHANVQGAVALLNDSNFTDRCDDLSAARVSLVDTIGRLESNLKALSSVKQSRSNE